MRPASWHPCGAKRCSPAEPVAIVRAHEFDELAAVRRQIARAARPIPATARAEYCIEARRVPGRRAHAVAADDHHVLQLGPPAAPAASAASRSRANSRAGERLLLTIQGIAEPAGVRRLCTIRADSRRSGCRCNSRRPRRSDSSRKPPRTGHGRAGCSPGRRAVSAAAYRRRRWDRSGRSWLTSEEVWY